MRWLTKIERWIAYRTFERYHVVKTDLAPGYYDKDTVLLHVAFALLVRFVEIELGSRLVFFSEVKENSWTERLLNLLPWVVRKYFQRPSASSGLAYIERQLEQIDSIEYVSDEWKINHKAFYNELKALYLWWLARRDRPCAWDSEEIKATSGAIEAAYGETHTFQSRDGGCCLKRNGTEEQQAAYTAATSRAIEQEEAWEEEDTEMLVRLCKIRRAMWT